MEIPPLLVAPFIYPFATRECKRKEREESTEDRGKKTSRTYSSPQEFPEGHRVLPIAASPGCQTGTIGRKGSEGVSIR